MDDIMHDTGFCSLNLICIVEKVSEKNILGAFYFWKSA
jgi:hypothetical protein